MSFRVKRSLVLKECTDMVKGLLLMPRWRHRVWTAESLHEYLVDLGQDFTLEEVDIINDELHSRGVVEDVSG